MIIKTLLLPLGHISNKKMFNTRRMCGSSQYFHLQTRKESPPTIQAPKEGRQVLLERRSQGSILCSKRLLPSNLCFSSHQQNPNQCYYNISYHLGGQRGNGNRKGGHRKTNAGSTSGVLLSEVLMPCNKRYPHYQKIMYGVFMAA